MDGRAREKNAARGAKTARRGSRALGESHSGRAGAPTSQTFSELEALSSTANTTPASLLPLLPNQPSCRRPLIAYCQSSPCSIHLDIAQTATHPRTSTYIGQLALASALCCPAACSLISPTKLVAVYFSCCSISCTFHINQQWIAGRISGPAAQSTLPGPRAHARC